MKIIYTSDLHGIEWKYDRLAEAALDAGVEAVVNGGDMLPKHGNLLKQGEFIEGKLSDFLHRLSSKRIWHLGYLGNDDLKIFDGVFDDVCSNIQYAVNLAQRKISLGKYEFIGMNWVTDYPFRLKDRCRIDSADYVFQEQFGSGLSSNEDGFEDIEDWFSHARSMPSIEDELENLPEPALMSHAIYVIHMPPSGIGLDQCFSGDKVGSEAIYRFLKEKQPRLSLHGHIHESPRMSGIWKNRIGETFCIQPGQTELFSYVIADLDSMSFQREVVY